MSDPITPSQLRADIYRLIDRVLDTGEALEIDRRGRLLRLVPGVVTPKLSRLRPLDDLVVGAPDDLSEIDWSREWSAGDGLDP